ncbi:MAG: hypothetical protein ACAI44_08465, partial [Candidatus Sericytochromatia bacterium]
LTGKAMSLKFLGLIQKEAGKLRQDRQQSLEPLLREGLEHLFAAESTGFTDPARLKQASVCFIRAQQAAQQDVRPALFLAYVFLLLGDLRRASLYLTEARRHDPRHPLVQEFSEKLIELNRQKPAKSTSHNLNLHHDRDPDHLYEETEQAIMTQVRLLQELRPLESGVPASELRAFVEQLAEFHHNHAQIIAELGFLEQHLDTMALKARLRPLEILLRRHEAQLQAVQEVQEVLDGIQSLREDVGHALLRLEAGVAIDKAAYELQLERFLDRMDALADRIDEQEAKGHKSMLLEQNYERLLPRLEDYRDLLDGLSG